MPSGGARDIAANMPEFMLRRMRELWDERVGGVPRYSGTAIADALKREFPLYPGSLTRSSVLAVAARCRLRSEYKTWFPPRDKRAGVHFKSKPPAVPKPKRNTNPLGAKITAVGSKPQRKPSNEVNHKRGRFTSTYVPVDEEVNAKIVDAGQKFASKQFVPLDDSKPVTLMERGVNQCEWPVEVEGRTLYCGCPKVTLRYCEVHARR